MILPLYKRVASGLRSLRDFMVKCWQSAKKMFVRGLQFAVMILGGVKSIFGLLGRGYLGLLTLMMNYFLQWGKIGDLVFTFLALIYFALPLIISYLFYWKNIAIIPSAIMTVVSIIKGYNTIKHNH